MDHYLLLWSLFEKVFLLIICFIFTEDLFFVHMINLIINKQLYLKMYSIGMICETDFRVVQYLLHNCTVHVCYHYDTVYDPMKVIINVQPHEVFF